VALVGKLEDVPPGEILMILSDSEKTGKLNVTTGTQEGMIVFRAGKIIYAASSSIRETFGSIALTLQIVSSRQLEQAVQLQYRSHEDKRLGEILVELGAMRQQDVERVLAHQVSQVVREIFEWKTGYFRFRNLEIEEEGDVEVDARDFIAGSPLDTRSVALDAARELDETTRAAEAERARVEAEAEAEAEIEEPAEPTTLAELMAEVAGPALTAETIRDIFVVAAASVSRGVIFLVRDHSALGLAQFGLPDGDAPPSQRVRQLVLSMDEYSLISTAVRDGEAFRGVPDQVRANSQLIRALGEGWPAEVVVVPMLVGDRVALVFYGDNLPRNNPIGSTATLEETLAAVGRRLEEARR
jgi:hypothetical protein